MGVFYFYDAFLLRDGLMALLTVLLALAGDAALKRGRARDWLATGAALGLFTLGKETGTLESGKFADILAIDGDPSKDINVLCSKDNIRMVMKEGEPWVDKISAQQRRVIQFEPGSWKIIDDA